MRRRPYSVLPLDQTEKAHVYVFNTRLQVLDDGRLAEIGHQREFGARPLRRTIQREIDNEPSRRVLRGDIGFGQVVEVSVQDGRLTFTAREAA